MALSANKDGNSFKFLAFQYLSCLTLFYSSMYDVDGNGWIDLVEMTKIVRSIYKMMGPNVAMVDQFETPEKRAEDIFRRMDANSDGRVTRQEFVRSCLNDSKLSELLSPR